MLILLLKLFISSNWFPLAAMDKVMIDWIDLNKFIQVIVNVAQESVSNCIEQKSKKKLS